MVSVGAAVGVGAVAVVVLALRRRDGRAPLLLQLLGGVVPVSQNPLQKGDVIYALYLDGS